MLNIASSTKSPQILIQISKFRGFLRFQLVKPYLMVLEILTIDIFWYSYLDFSWTLTLKNILECFSRVNWRLYFQVKLVECITHLPHGYLDYFWRSALLYRTKLCNFWQIWSCGSINIAIWYMIMYSMQFLARRETWLID